MAGCVVVFVLVMETMSLISSPLGRDSCFGVRWLGGAAAQQSGCLPSNNLCQPALVDISERQCNLQTRTVVRQSK